MTQHERLARILLELERKGFVIVQPPDPPPRPAWWRELLDILQH